MKINVLVKVPMQKFSGCMQPNYIGLKNDEWLTFEKTIEYVISSNKRNFCIFELPISVTS